ncbi:MAG: hypothetical protein GY855_11970 [candidate division Zixibacteria bacterium]|nr:hypothetical protein [candidate division Zixibacteria bacterium]
MRHYSKIILLIIGIAALFITILSATDLFTDKPNDGLIWKLGGDEVRVVGVIENGPADIAGIRPGDVVLGIGQFLIESPLDAVKILARQNIDSEVSYLIKRDSEIFTTGIVLTSYRAGNFKYIYLICMGLIFALVGSYVFYIRPDYPPSRLFYLMSLSFMVFLACSLRRSSYYWIDIIIENADALALFLMPAFFLHFFFIFPRRKNIFKKYKFLIYIVYSIPPLLYLEYTFHQIFGLGIPIELMGINLNNWIVIGIYMTMGIVLLGHTRITTLDTIEKRQIRIMFWGTILGVLPFITLGVGSVLIFRTTDYVFISTIPLILVPLSFAYSIFRHQLFEVEFIIRKGLVNTILTAGILIAYILIVEVIGYYLEPVLGNEKPLILLGAILVIAVAFAPLRQWIQNIVDRLFYKRDYSFNKSLSLLTEPLSPQSGIEDIGRTIVEKFGNAVGTKNISLFFKDDESREFKRIASFSEEQSVEFSNIIRFDDALIEFIKSKDKPVYIRDINSNQSQIICNSPMIETLNNSGFEIIAPLKNRDNLLGMILIGSKSVGSYYSPLELELLNTASHQVIVSLDNARLVHNISEANRKLLLSEHLATLGRLAAGVAHEIRNPLSSIRLNLQALMRSANPSDADTRRLEITLNETNRLEKLVQEMLIFAKPIDLEIEKTSLAEIVKSSFHNHRSEIRNKNVELEVNINPASNTVFVDKQRLEQVLMNVIGNSLSSINNSESRIRISADSYTNDGTLEIKGILITIEDNGGGIADADKEKIFEPFFTTRADGTGLGLANCKKFIELHKGWIRLSYSSPEGTGFEIFLPSSPEGID